MPSKQANLQLIVHCCCSAWHLSGSSTDKVVPAAELLFGNWSALLLICRGYKPGTFLNRTEVL